MSDYTAKERATIKRAWLQVSYLMCSSDLEGRFDELILRDKREQTKSLHASRVLMCRYWFKGFDNPSGPLSSVAYVTPTACQAAMYGVRMSEGYGPDNRTGWVAKARKAQAAAELALDASTARHMAELRL